MNLMNFIDDWSIKIEMSLSWTISLSIDMHIFHVAMPHNKIVMNVIFSSFEWVSDVLQKENCSVESKWTKMANQMLK